jgi:hypothetical protein
VYSITKSNVETETPTSFLVAHDRTGIKQKARLPTELLSNV